MERNEPIEIPTDGAYQHLIAGWSKDESTIYSTHFCTLYPGLLEDQLDSP